jgi:hypothetical protein
MPLAVPLKKRGDATFQQVGFAAMTLCCDYARNIANRKIIGTR